VVQVFGVLRVANWPGLESSGLRDVAFEDCDGSHSLEVVRHCRGYTGEGNLMVGVDTGTLSMEIDTVGVVPRDRGLDTRMMGCSSILQLVHRRDMHWEGMGSILVMQVR
jgi:hypothetical protein